MRNSEWELDMNWTEKLIIPLLDRIYLTPPNPVMPANPSAAHYFRGSVSKVKRKLGKQW